MGIATAYRYASEHRDRYAEFFGPDGSLEGPALTRRRGGAAAGRAADSGIVVVPCR